MTVLTTTLTLKELKKQVNVLPIDIDADICIIYNEVVVLYIVTDNAKLARLLADLDYFTIEANSPTLVEKIVHAANLPGSRLSGKCWSLGIESSFRVS